MRHFTLIVFQKKNSKRLYLVEGAPSLQTCWDLTLGHAVRENGINRLEFPSCSSFKRRLRRDVPKQSIYLARYGQTAWNRKFGNYMNHYNGLKKATLDNWDGVAYIGERKHIPVLQKIEQLSYPGIYFLIGNDKETNENILYIGKSSNIANRLQTHNSDKSKDWFERFIVFTSKNGDLNSSHAEYLEADFIELAQQNLGSITLDNACGSNVKKDGKLTDMYMPRVQGFRKKALTLINNLNLLEFLNTGEEKQTKRISAQSDTVFTMNLKRNVTLAFDASYQGESEGEPRYIEDPYSRVEDIRSAIDYLITLDYVDEDKIGAMGICAGGGYTMSAIQTEYRIKAAAGVSSWNIGKSMREGNPNALSYDAMKNNLTAIAAQRTKEAKGEAPLYVGVVPNSPDEFEAFGNSTIMKEGYEYYRTPRCQYPTSVNKMRFAYLDNVVSFDAFQYIYTVAPRPILLIVGSIADTAWFKVAIVTLCPIKTLLPIFIPP